MAAIGFAGLGKLGLPVALTIEGQGHHVIGYDPNPDIGRYVSGELDYPHEEKYVRDWLKLTRLEMAESIGDVVANSDIIFCPVQTPHAPQYEGSTRLPDRRVDFDYLPLQKAIGSIVAHARMQKRDTTLAVISTCLPGTYERSLKFLLNPYVDYVYTPQFIAMGTVVDDYRNPEFNLIGVESQYAADKLEDFYQSINDAPNIRTDITTAEGIKMSYNTWITAKTVIANAWGEMAHKTGMNFDDIKRAWDLSTKRLLSAKYMDAGVGDGGGCHPRDNIALSYLADKVGMSHNIWEDLMHAREDHMAWLGQQAVTTARQRGLPLVILGASFKPETNITTGSASVLMANIIEQDTDYYVEHVEDLDRLPPAVYVIGTKHDRYTRYQFPQGSVVYDPFRFLPKQDGVTIIGIGNGNKHD